MFTYDTAAQASYRIEDLLSAARRDGLARRVIRTRGRRVRRTG